MKAISLWQPWASLLVQGDKQIETRSWRTHYTGWLAVHATRRFTGEQHDITLTSPFSDYLPHPNHLPRGAVLGVVHIAGYLATATMHTEIADRERVFGDYSPGRWAWLADWHYAFDTPVEASGQQGLWNWEPPDEASRRAVMRAQATYKELPTVVNLRQAEYDVYIGRRSYDRPQSLWANPYKVNVSGTRAEVLETYGAYIRDKLEGDQALRWRLALSALRGRRLGCWCKPKSCHGDVLVNLIESGEYDL